MAYLGAHVAFWSLLRHLILLLSGDERKQRSATPCTGQISNRTNITVDSPSTNTAPEEVDWQ